jgi:hypothetical protein
MRNDANETFYGSGSLKKPRAQIINFPIRLNLAK